MATKLDQPSPAENHRAKSTAPQSLTPKISIFGTKSGFVIPKNKLAGSLVTRAATAKNEIPTASKEDNTRQVQRKTKWGPDLATDPAVCKGRALAYQTRVEQITKQLKSETSDLSKIEGSTGNGSNYDGSDNLKENKQGNVELLELERREIIGEILRLNPGYKLPENYKPVLKETIIPLPETGAVIQVFGTKKISGEKSEIHLQDINETQAAYEDLHINVSADSYDKVDAAVALIELLLAPVSVKSAATSTATTVSSTVTSDVVNPGQSTTSVPGLLHYQSQNTPWLSTLQTDAPSIPSSGPVLSTLPTNSLQPQPLAGSFSMPPYTGQPPHMNSMPRNPFPAPVPQQSIPSNQQHPSQFHANSIGPFGQPPGTVSPQMRSSSSVPPPVRPLQTPHASGGWPSFSPIMSQSQWPAQASPTFVPVRPPVSVSPFGTIPPQGPVALTPPSNMPTMYHSQQPAVANFTCSSTIVSRPPVGALSFSTVAAPQGPSSVAFPGGASAQSAYPRSIGPPPAFSPGMVPPSVASSCLPASGPSSTSCSQAPIGALRPPRPVAGDFTFRPVVSPAPDFSTPGGKTGIQGRSQPGTPFLHPGNQSPSQGFQRPMNMMDQARMHAPPPPHIHGAFPRNPSLELHAGFRGIPPAVYAPLMPAPSGFLPPRPFQPRSSPQQGPFSSRNWQGGDPVYNPLAPAAAQKTEASDPEYEDLMASVGVK
ncbi:hypothetical protein HU200_065372 [Digitaria exilis]|uniref:Uncharacterized protein n=1 Tax=Digitaria exilis TaxID=1010633 RepID=A0A835A406_9POAL|nr:hypothetical protein HU200_065372 [Digitaria exilis]